MPDRLIKQSICESETIDQLSWFEECLFYRLVVHCDDRGRFDARPKIVKNLLFPLKDDMSLDQVEAGLQGLERAGLIKVYSGGRYLYMPTWEKHQRIRHVKPKYPDPSDVDTCGNLPQFAAECGEPQQSAAECSKLRLSHARAESNPIVLVVNNKYTSVPIVPGNPGNPGKEQQTDIVTYARKNLLSFNDGACIEDMRDFLDHGVEEDAIRFAIDCAVNQGKTTWSYVQGIVNRWLVKGIKTLAAARDAERKYQENKAKGGKPGGKHPGGNGSGNAGGRGGQGEPDDAEIDRIEGLRAKARLPDMPGAQVGPGS